MLIFQQLRGILAPADPAGQTEMKQLRDRVTELEEENSNLRRLEETIRKNTRVFDVLLEKSREGILLITPDLIILRLVHSALGYQEQEMSGQSVYSLVHPDDMGFVKSSFDALLNSSVKSASCEFRARHKDGSWAWVAGEFTDMLDDPDVQAILLNVRNVTNQKDEWAAREKLESLGACSDYALCSVSMNGVILEWNRGAQKIFGYSPEEIVGQNISILAPENLCLEETSLYANIARGPELPAFNTVRIRKDGKRVEIQLKLAPIRGKDGCLEAVLQLAHVVRAPE